MKTQGGQNSFAVLLFQDIAVIPMLAILPLLAVGAQGAGHAAGAHALAENTVHPTGDVANGCTRHLEQQRGHALVAGFVELGD